jgi:hypothetical protein
MKKVIMILVLCFFAISIYCYTMGQYVKTFYDPSRNRNILTWIYYPISESNPQEIFPYIIFGHGWNGDCTYYTSYTMAMINKGWIIAYPRTEEGIFSYNPPNLAQDMAFLKNAVLAENLLSTSPIFGKVQDLAVVGGYSMGGACAVAAATMNTTFASLVTMAAAPITLLNLYPSAINLAYSVTIPSVTFSGSTDVIAPPNANQVPIYNNLASEYKSYVSLTGQGHDSFYNNSLIYDVLDPWLNFVRTGSGYYIDTYEELLVAYPASALTYQISDNLLIIPAVPMEVSIEKQGGNLVISWDRIMEAHGYKVLASDSPVSEFYEVTIQGSFTTSARINWTAPIPEGNWKFYEIKSFRQ